ncbi:MAG TPA: DUF1592 domain-containing protein [Bryobacteraceae bacterium]|nr:DUF1592 domain-containing protein [Bryobacteraceae bacterium]
MKTRLLCCRMAILSATVVYAQVPPKTPSSIPQRALVDQYCAGCHNDKAQSGNMSLTKLDLAHPGQNPELAEKVIRKVGAGMMPPAGLPRPAAPAAKAFVTSLENAVDQAAALHPNPGRPALHRLNRTEYANSIRDLLAVNIDVTALLPTDDMSHGFDNMADVLTISPALMEGYIRAAGRISREAVGDTTALPLTSTYTIPRVASQMRHVDGTPFGTRGGIAVVHDFPADGEYSFRLGFYYVPEGPLFGQNMGKGQQIEVAVDGERIALLDINPSMKLSNDGIKVPPVHISAGPHRISASFPMKFDGPVEDEFRPVEQSLVDVSTGNIPGMTSLPHLHEFQVTGPHKVSGLSDTPSRRKIFVCRPTAGTDELPCAKKIVAAIARQAYRRPVTDSDLEGLLNFYQSGRNSGDFESGVRTAIQAVISSPEFVFRFERTPAGVAPGHNYRISDLELASRLSYFLWSSAPDDQLLTVASQGRLKDPLVLEKQVRRMLADPKSESLATIFAGEWLHLQNLKDVNPDLYLFPNFDRTLAQSMRRETELLFDSIMREDRNVLDLLTANYTFVDERLAKHYGIPNVLGNRFRRVPLTDPNRFGVLGQGSILTLTSTANRTSPVARGKYVMEVLLGTPPPNAPPNVPALKENSDARTGKVLSRPLSVRERMEEHRSDPACASCHKMMDPIGFALENFDAVGLWRTNDGPLKIDSTGKMFDGARLDGPASLRQAILNHSDSYLSAFAENLLAYGMGRVLETYDMPVVRSIRREAARNDNRFSSFVLGIVKSAPFQMRRAEETETAPTTPMAGN